MRSYKLAYRKCSLFKLLVSCNVLVRVCCDSNPPLSDNWQCVRRGRTL